MSSVNKAIIVGRLGQDPESRFMPSGDAVCNISVATGESWKDKASGEKKEHTEWHRVSFFGKLAEIAGQYLKKGSQVYIEGSLRTRKWQDKEGQDRYTTEIRADQMKMLGPRHEGGDEQPAKESGPEKSGSKGSSAAGTSRSSGFDDMSDDIPFLFNMNTVCDTIGKPLSFWRSRYGKELSTLRANKTDF